MRPHPLTVTQVEACSAWDRDLGITEPPRFKRHFEIRSYRPRACSNSELRLRSSGQLSLALWLVMDSDCPPGAATRYTTRHRYDAFDELTKITDPKGEITSSPWDLPVHDPDERYFRQALWNARPHDAYKPGEGPQGTFVAEQLLACCEGCSLGVWRLPKS